MQVDQYTLTLNGKTLKNYLDGPLVSIPHQPPYTVLVYENDQPSQGHGTLKLSADIYPDSTRSQAVTRCNWMVNLP